MPATRPPMRRILEMDALLRSGTPPRVDDFALRFEVDRRTVYRDLAFLRAWDHGRKALRSFALDRMDAVEKLDRSFPPPDPKVFDPAALDRTSFRGRTGGRLYKVRLCFDAPAAPHVRGRIWHATQKLLDLPDDSDGDGVRDPGGVILELTVPGLEQITSWVLSWGARVTVLGPESLRKRVLAEARDLVRKHGGEGGR